MSTDLASSGDAFTPEEQAYISSRGESVTPPAAEPAPSSAPAQQQAPAANDDDLDVDTIEIGEDGIARNKTNGRYVPHSYAQRLKTERNETREKLNAISAELIRARERNAIFNEYAPQKPANEQVIEPRKPVDPTEDIFGAFTYLQEELKAAKEEIAKTSSETKAQFEARATNEYYQQDLARFTQAKPDFEKALQHATMVQDKILQARGVADPAKRQEMIVGEIQDLIKDGYANKKSWAETVYTMAEAFGYQGAQPEPPKPAVDPNAAAEIERINKGKAASQTLRGSGSSGGVEQLTVERLVQMSDSDFGNARKEYIAKHGRAAWGKLMEGR
ncbi:MAG: hypothetical protein Q7T86_03155 [Hyphomicrobiaceae bacterium]|nr:hypothetical protein [Hyphomicrobiaceae bacterium]